MVKRTGSEQIREKSFAFLVRQLMQESPKPLTVKEILRRVNRMRHVDTRSPESTIRSAISQCDLIANDGKGKYGWFPRMLKGSIVRAPLSIPDLKQKRIIIEDDVRDLLWPSLFVSQRDLSDRNPVDIELPDGTHTPIPLDFFGQGVWGTTGSPNFWKWLKSCKAMTGDSLLIEAVDAEKRQYRVKFDSQAERDVEALQKRTAEVEQAAQDYLWKHRAYGSAIWRLSRHLLASGYYKHAVPPETISAIWDRIIPAQMIGESMIGRQRMTRRQPGKIYQLKITLFGSAPPIWRRLLVADIATLFDLHWIIQISMGWTNSHLHQFIIEGKFYSDPDFELGDDFGKVHDEYETTLKSVIKAKNARLAYEYDFGDGWEHEITVEKILQSSSAETYPRCIDGARACPPEDVGGIWGYEDFLIAIGDPSHEEHDDLLEWAGGSFDPEHFDIDSTNRQLKRVDRVISGAGN